MKSKVIKRPDFLEFVSIFRKFVRILIRELLTDWMWLHVLRVTHSLPPVIACSCNEWRNLSQSPQKPCNCSIYCSCFTIFLLAAALCYTWTCVRVGSVQCSIYFRAFVMTSSGRNFEHVTVPCVVFKVTRLFESASQHVLMPWRCCLLAARATGQHIFCWTRKIFYEWPSSSPRFSSAANFCWSGIFCCSCRKY